MIFVDSSYWISFADTDEERHDVASALAAEHAVARFVTTNHIVGETWTFLRRTHGHRVATAFLDRTEQTQRLEIAFVTAELERDAWSWLRRHDERSYSFVDATSFALMRHLRIREVFAFDADFAAAGFVELRA